MKPAAAHGVRPGMWRSLVVVAMLASPAAAEFAVSGAHEPEPVTPRLRIGAPGDKLALQRIAMAIQQDALGTTAQITLLVTTTETAAREAEIAVEVPQGARVSGVALTIGKTERMVARASSVEQARADYLRVRDGAKDPILVEWKRDTPGGYVVDVRAFPLTKKEPGRIELTIELPAITALTLDATAPSIEINQASRSTTYRKHAQPITIELQPDRAIAAPLIVPRPHVGPYTSFYAGFAPTLAVPTVTIGSVRPRTEPHSLDGREIRKEIKRHRARLGWCWERSVQFAGGPDAVANLHFVIDRSGKVTSSSVDGTLTNPEVATCLLEVVRTFEFRAGDRGIEVNYPLSFRLAGS